jgi:hypothetical protein
MKYLEQYSCIIIILVFCYVGLTDNSTIRIGIFILVLLSFIYSSIKTIIDVKKSQIIDAEIISFDPNYKVDTDGNSNFLVLVNLHLPNQEFKEINVKGLYFKPPQKGDKIKILLNEDDINQSKIFTGTEIIGAYVQMAAILIALFFTYFYTYVLPIKQN